MTKEEQLLAKRLIELSFITFNKDIPTYSDFLNLNEINIFHTLNKELAPVSYSLVGGFDQAERKIIMYYPMGSDTAYMGLPITCLEISPLNNRFSDALTHRDFLGAILNLGIDRSKIGDIIIKENCGFVFCNTGISTYIIDNLINIKHTSVTCKDIGLSNLDIEYNYKTIKGSVSSIRLDSILALAFSTSRSSITGLIQGGKVFVNGKLIESNSHILKENDIVSVRGLGKFVYSSVQSITKKGRYMVIIQRYI